jgi:hypothetical protein
MIQKAHQVMPKSSDGLLFRVRDFLLLGMRIVTYFILLAFCLLLPDPAKAQTYDDVVDNLNEWLKDRVERHDERLEFPLCVRSQAWGCVCPDAYMGISPNTQEGPWIFVLASEDFPVVDEEGHSLIVVGRFTGEYKVQGSSEEEEEFGGSFYTMPIFELESWRINDLGYDVPAPKILPSED